MRIETLSRACGGTVLLAALAVLTSGCEIRTRSNDYSDDKDVEIRTPLGDLSARTDADGRHTGLPVYPGAQLVRDDDDGDSADVEIDTAFFGLKVAAAKFEVDDDPETVVAFYRRAMQSFGDTVECRGKADFKGRRGRKRPVCRESRWSSSTQFVAGTEERPRIVVIKPRGRGAEIALVSVNVASRW
jgi:hypothetical protein